MKLETAIGVWQEVAEYERDTFGVARSSLTFPGASSTEVEIRLGPDSAWPDEVDLIPLCDIAAGHGATLLLHTTGGLVIR